MPFHVHIIGPATFDALLGEIQREVQEPEIIQRKGVDGAGIRRTGVRGRPYQIQTWRYETSYHTAEIVMDGYQSLIGRDPQIIVKNSIVQRGFHQVLRVEKVAIHPCATAVGTIVADPQALLIAQWTLLPMPIRTFVRQT